MALKYFRQNRIINLCDIIQNKFRLKQSLFGDTLKQIAKVKFLKTLVYEHLQTTIGPCNYLVQVSSEAEIFSDPFLLFSPSRSDLSKNMITLESCFRVETNVVILTVSNTGTVLFIFNTLKQSFYKDVHMAVIRCFLTAVFSPL